MCKGRGFIPSLEHDEQVWKLLEGRHIYSTQGDGTSEQTYKAL